MEAIQEFLEKTLQTVDLKTITKRELKQIYLKEQGIAKLSKNEKNLFSTAVESAYIDLVKKETSTSEAVIKDNNTEVNTCKSDSESVNSDVANDLLQDSGLGVSHKESLETVEKVKLIGNQVNPTEDNENFSAQESPVILNYDSFQDPSNSLKKEPVDFPNGNSDDDSVMNINEEKEEKSVVDTSGKLDDGHLMSKEDIKNSVSNGCSSDSDNETLIKKKKEEPVVDPSEESDDEHLTSEKGIKNSVSNGCSSDSDNEPLIKKKKEEPVVDPSEESDDEPLMSKKNIKNSVSNAYSSDSDNEPLIQSKKKHQKETLSNVSIASSESQKELLGSKKNEKLQNTLNIPKRLKNRDMKVNKAKKRSVLSDSDEELLPTKKAKRQKKSLSGDAKNSKKKVDSKSTIQKLKPLRRIQKSFLDSSDSDELPLILAKTQDNPKKNLKSSSHKGTRKSSKNDSNRKILSDSDNESSVPTKKRKKLLKRKSELSSDGSYEHGASSSDSDEPLSSFKTKTQMQKSLSKSSNDETDNEVENNKQSAESNLKEENKSSKEDNDISLADDDSDENSLTGSNVSDSDEEPLASFSKNKSPKKISPTQNKSVNNEEKTASESNVSHMSTHEMDTSDSEPLSNFAKKNVKLAAKPKTSAKRKKFESSSDESEAQIVKKSKTKSEVKKVVKQSVAISSDSEDKPLAVISKSDAESNEDSSMDENEEKPIAKSKLKGTTKVNKVKEQKKQTPSEGKLENLKKYIRAAGMHIKSYDKLFVDCKTMKSKSEKLLSMLEKEGLKGRPSLAKCKKLKKKIETKKEVAELDPKNIISSGRPKRTACSDTTNCINNDDSDDVPLAKYSRLKGIIDSEESD